MSFHVNRQNLSSSTYKISGLEDWRRPILFSAPHAGQEFPKAFLEQSPLSKDALLATADLNTERLITFEGTASIHAHFARSFIDLNRSRSQLDPNVIDDLQPSRDMQVFSGYGVIPRFAAKGHLTRQGKISKEAAEVLLKRYYDPYHHALQKLAELGRSKFGRLLIVEVHSAPASVMEGVDIVFGSCFGESCAPEKVDFLASACMDLGLRISKEIPFSGGFITQNYSKMDKISVLQIEVNRKHMNAQMLENFQKTWGKLWDLTLTKRDFL